MGYFRSMRNLAALLFLTLLPTATLIAQGFQLTFGGAYLQDAVATLSDATGYHTLVREVFPTGDRVRIRLLHTDLQGQNQQWYNVAIPGACFVQAAVASGDGNITLCGSCIAPGRSDQDALIAKISPTGAVLWAWTSSTPGTQEELRGLQPTDDGGFVACGAWRGTADSDALIVRTYANGTLMWQHQYGTEADECAQGIATDGNGYMMAGRINNFGGDADAYVLRIDNAGNELWWQSWGGVKDDLLMAIIHNGNGFVMAGYTDSYGPVTGGQPVRSVYIMAMDAAGDTLWTRTIGNIGQARSATDIQLASNGNLLLAGQAGNDHLTDAMVMCISAAGQLNWVRTYDLANEDMLHRISPLQDGGFIAAGRSFGANGAQAALIRKNASGN